MFLHDFAKQHTGINHVNLIENATYRANMAACGTVMI